MNYLSIPEKHPISYFLLFFPFVTAIPYFSKIMQRYCLHHCNNCTYEPGFRFYYGNNIYADRVAFSNCVLMDYDVIKIGRNSAFSKDCIVITADHDLKDRNKIVTNPVVIGEHVWIATRSIILSGVTIGDHSVIGAGSVVTKSIPPHCLAAGNPAKIIKRI